MNSVWILNMKSRFGRFLGDGKISETSPLNQGFTLIELLVAIGITALIVGIALANFGRYQAQRSVEGALEITLAQITRAHLDTISSRNDIAYGARLESDRVTYFAGATYNGGDARNITQLLPYGTEIVSIALAGGGSDIMFKRVTGDTNQPGTFIIRSKSYTDIMKTITINGVGSIVY
jgi:prepilin-type N-terminal cleavage/methylation domain-containing protein